MITLPQLKELAKQNKIPFTCMNKDEIIALLIDKNIITPSDLLKSKIVELKEKHEAQTRYDYIKGIRNNPKRIEIFNKQTGETSIFPSKYKTARALKINPFYIKDGTIWKERYVIKVLCD